MSLAPWVILTVAAEEWGHKAACRGRIMWELATDSQAPLPLIEYRAVKHAFGQ